MCCLERTWENYSVCKQCGRQILAKECRSKLGVAHGASFVPSWGVGNFSNLLENITSEKSPQSLLFFFSFFHMSREYLFLSSG